MPPGGRPDGGDAARHRRRDPAAALRRDRHQRLRRPHLPRAPRGGRRGRDPAGLAVRRRAGRSGLHPAPYPALADNPTKKQIRAAFEDPVPEQEWTRSDAAVRVRDRPRTEGATARTGSVCRPPTPASRSPPRCAPPTLVGWLDRDRYRAPADRPGPRATPARRPGKRSAVRRPDFPPTWLVLARAPRTRPRRPGRSPARSAEFLDELGKDRRAVNHGETPTCGSTSSWSDPESKLGRRVIALPRPGSVRRPARACPTPATTPTPRTTDCAVRRDLALPPADLEAHWGPRSPRRRDRRDADGCSPAAPT